MLVTALNPQIGYDHAAKVAKKAEDTTCEKPALNWDFLQERNLTKLFGLSR